MAIWACWRCSTDAQDEERQIKALNAAGCERLYGDKITGTSSYGDRDQLSRCLDGLRAGDSAGSVEAIKEALDLKAYLRSEPHLNRVGQQLQHQVFGDSAEMTR